MLGRLGCGAANTCRGVVGYQWIRLRCLFERRLDRWRRHVDRDIKRYLRHRRSLGTCTDRRGASLAEHTEHLSERGLQPGVSV